MDFVRLPRFKRSFEVAPMQLTERDREIIRLVHRHRFLRSSHIITLIGEGSQPLLRRLQLLYHHGFLERPRAQIDYYHRGGSRHIVYGLGNKGAALLKRESDLAFHELQWGRKNRAISRIFLEHALLVSDVMVSIELACRETGGIELLTANQLALPAETRRRRNPFQWKVRLDSGCQFGVVPDSVFALRSSNPASTAYFFLEADRGTMPIERKTFAQSSFQRKLLAYEATWNQNLHRARFGFHRFRVLTVTEKPERAQHLAAAANRLESGRGLFLFAPAQSLLAETPLSPVWQTPLSALPTSLLS